MSAAQEKELRARIGALDKQARQIERSMASLSKELEAFVRERRSLIADLASVSKRGQAK